MSAALHADALPRITPLHPVIGARCEGLDLRHPLTRAQAAAVEAAMDRHAVLVLPAQRIDDDLQLAFGRNFGAVEAVPSLVAQDRRRLPDNQVNDISNLGPDGQLLAADDRRRMYNLGNLLWHSDSSFKATPAKYSMLHARVLPPDPPATEFAEMRAAWDALPQQEQEQVQMLVAEHSLMFSRAQLGFADFTPEEQAACAPVPQRLVRRHMGSGRLSLYLSAHIGGIRGLPRPEALMLVRELTEHATQRQFVYAHHWQPGDLVVWDNRCTMHRARPFADKTHPRDMRRVTIGDCAPTLEQPL